MSTWTRGRKLLIAFATLTLVVALSAIAMTSLPTREVQAASNCTYYSDATKTVVVGRFGYDCCNNPVSWGRKTKFSTCGGCFPCVPPPRD